MPRRKQWIWVILSFVLVGGCIAADATTEEPEPEADTVATTAAPTPTPTPESTPAIARTPAPTPSAAPTPAPRTHLTPRDASEGAYLLAELSEVDLPTGLPFGNVLNVSGARCEYVQAAKDMATDSYFYEGLTGAATYMAFAVEGCMAYANEFELGVNQFLINQLVKTWYSFPDAAFQTELQDITELAPPDRGWCIQSDTYESVAIVVEYFVEDQSIVAVLHTYGLPC